MELTPLEGGPKEVKRVPRAHGGGVYLLLGTAIIRAQLDVGTGHVDLEYEDWDGPTDRKKLSASWTVKKLKSEGAKEFLGKLGGVVMEMTNMDRTPLETFRVLKRKMIGLLPKEQRPKEVNPEESE